MFCTWTDRVEQIMRQAAQRGFHVAILQEPLHAPFSFIDGGLLLLSRFPVLYHSSIIYSTASSEDRLVNKGAIYAKLKLPRSSFGFDFLHLFCTHAQASFVEHFLPDGSLAYDPESVTRKRQAEEFTDFMSRELAAAEEDLQPILIIGDWNVLTFKGVPDHKFFEYSNLVSMLKGAVKRLKYHELYDLNPEHKGTFFKHGDITDDRVVPYECYDYMFLAMPNAKDPSLLAKIIPFSVGNLVKSGTGVCRLSDHCGVSLSLVGGK
jgi:hypothetical protein